MNSTTTIENRNDAVWHAAGCLRVTFPGGLIESIFEYDGQRAHEELVQRSGLAAGSEQAA